MFRPSSITKKGQSMFFLGPDFAFKLKSCKVYNVLLSEQFYYHSIIVIYIFIFVFRQTRCKKEITLTVFILSRKLLRCSTKSLNTFCGVCKVIMITTATRLADVLAVGEREKLWSFYTGPLKNGEISICENKE